MSDYVGLLENPVEGLEHPLSVKLFFVSLDLIIYNLRTPSLSNDVNHWQQCILPKQLKIVIKILTFKIHKLPQYRVKKKTIRSL